MFKKTILLSLCFIKINGADYSFEGVADSFKTAGVVVLMSLPIKCAFQNFLTKKYNSHCSYFKAFPVGTASLLTGLVAAMGVYWIGDKIFNKQYKK